MFGLYSTKIVMKFGLIRKTQQFLVLVIFVMLLYGCSSEENQPGQKKVEEPEKSEIIQKPSTYAYYEILTEDFYQLTKEEGQKWQAHFDSLDYHQVLVLTELKSQEDFEAHNEYLEKYISASEHYLEFLINLKSKASEKFTAYNIPIEQVTPVLEYLLSVYETQKGTLTALLKAHIDYGKNMQSLLKFLQINQQEWILVDGKIDMEDKELASQYNNLIDKIILVEDQIEKYSKELNFLLR